MVHPIPKIDINQDGSTKELVCSNLSTSFETPDAGITDNSPTSNYTNI